MMVTWRLRVAAYLFRDSFRWLTHSLDTGA